jgi:hypothetical protein
LILAGLTIPVKRKRKGNAMDERYNELVRLLKATAKINIPVVQDMRRAAVDYINATERYISEIELDNLNLSTHIASRAKSCETHQRNIKRILINVRNANIQRG